jgi:hypothetical protein
MPYKSEKQRAYMHIHHPEIAKRWDAEESGEKPAKLPERAPSPKRNTIQEVAKRLVNPR